ncbi:Exosome non-catalytic core component [Tulasnella sp. 419]|nr:Exosome non-catalytic core component [Tulasnella sp. 419]
MSRQEILSAHNYRSDGRRPKELRDLVISLGSHPHATGSAYLSHGLTSVLVTVHGPREAKSRSNTQHDRAVLSVGVDLPAFSGGTGGRRGKSDKRTLEFTSTVKSTFEPIIQTHLYPRSQIDIFIQVLQQDGALLQAAINATTLALIDAGVAMSDYVCAITCALHDTISLLDLTNLEENDLPNLTAAVLPRSSKITLLTLETRIHLDRFEEMFKLAGEAGKVIHGEMLNAVHTRTDALVKSMGADSGAQSGRSADKQVMIDADMDDI